MRKRLQKSVVDSFHNHSIEELKGTGVYTITSRKRNKVYVGSTIKNTGNSPCTLGFKSRWEDHVTSLIRGKHYNKHLQRHVNKYGINDLEFEILEQCEPRFTASSERFWINMLDAVNVGFNQTYLTSMPYGKNHPQFRDMSGLEPEIINLYVNKYWSLKQIGKKFGVSEKPIKRVLLSNNINILRATQRIDYKGLHKEYLKSNLHAPEFARSKGIVECTLFRNFKRLNLKTKVMIMKDNLNIIHNRYLRGESLNKLAKEYKVNPSTISKTLTKVGLSMK